ncbi:MULTISPECIES: response regulator [Sorangium]|uniref:Response regulator n=1 Tax=Sorangium atrum TaxID=2995308 RepID=A0ABT5BT30_9BACT|nr:response regulator [Sorangium aterium]MDC0677319.1 response regulator [Sorangium aterium]
MTGGQAMQVQEAAQRGKRVLVIDDEEGMRVTLAASLELEGYEVVEARDGIHALELVRQQAFTLVISDIRMPGLNGVETFRELKRIQPELTVVLMTAFALEKLIEEAIAEGVYTVIHKPFSMDHLARIVARAVDSPAVLVVDDVPKVADSIVAVLRAAGLSALAVHDGRAAVQYVSERGIDVCVLDLVMPHQDGVTTCAQMRGLKKRVTVIAMTGHAVPEMVSAIMSKGGYACLHKPFDAHELIHTIARARGDAAQG